MWKVAFFFFVSLLPVAAIADQVGFKQITLSDSNTRNLEAAIWYPTQMTSHQDYVGGNKAFVGVPVWRDAPPAPGHHPLLLLSHGYGGSWRNLNWLAQSMAAQGYIVAAPDHPGTTTRDRNPDDATRLWQRPMDLNQLMDQLINQPATAGEVDETRIAAMGHSLGGWTVMELAGARFDPKQFIADCRQRPQLSDCKLTSTLGIDAPVAQEKLRSPLRNTRIKAVVSLDLGLARGFTKESLAAIHLPVLVLSAQTDSTELPASIESGYLAQSIPQRWVRFIRVPGATHFSFMQLCQPGGQALIEASSPGDGIVCVDETGFTRQQIHQSVMTMVSGFLNASLNYHPAGTPLVSSR
nr:alpha/beta fold hydrolase [Pantoea cypripedii]